MMAAPVHYRLSVGYFNPDGGAVLYESVVGRRLAETHEDRPVPVLEHEGIRSVHCELYESTEGAPYVVHSILELGRPSSALLGRLERYGRWADVMRNHPDLARTAVDARGAAYLGGLRGGPTI